MEVLRIVLTVLFVIDCIGLTVIILMQEGKSQGLGETLPVWLRPIGARNKGRSMEGNLVIITRIMAVLFFILALVLNLNF